MQRWRYRISYRAYAPKYPLFRLSSASITVPVGTRPNTIRLAERTWHQLGREANLQGVSMNQLVSIAVVTYLAHARVADGRAEADTYDQIKKVVEELR